MEWNHYRNCRNRRFFKKKDSRYERNAITVITTIATLQESIDESYAGYLLNITPGLDSEINASIGTAPLSPLDRLKTLKNIVDTLRERNKGELASSIATANIFYGRNPLNKDIVNNAVDFSNILYRDRARPIDIYKRWLNSTTSAYQGKVLSERIKILTEKSIALASNIAAIEAEEQQKIWREIAAWSSRYNLGKSPIVNQYNSDKSSVEQRVQAEIDRIETETGPTTGLNPAQWINRSIFIVRWLIDEKRKKLLPHFFLLLKYPGRDFKKADLKSFLERSVTYNPPDSELAFKDELDAIKSAYSADVLMDEINSLQDRLPKLYAAQSNIDADLIKATNLFRVRGAIAATRPVVVMPAGAIAATEGVATALQAAIRAAIASLAGFLASTASGLLVGVTALVYSPKLANGELPERYAFSTPLSDLAPGQDNDLQAIAAVGGTIDLPYRISSKTAEDGQSEVFVVKTDGVTVPSKVRVVAATYNTEQKVYIATTADSPPRTLTWTPIVNPGNSSTTSPVEPSEPPVYTGATVTPVQGRVDIFPGVSAAGFDDYVWIFPADSGLPPLYVMFRDRREDPGVAWGIGVPVTGNWLGAASQGDGAPIPSQIADQLRGREFKNFKGFREAFWRAVANDPELSRQFKKQNLSTILNGKAPFVIPSERAGTAAKFELHHKVYIAQDGAIFDMDNITIVTPKRHKQIHREEK